MSLEQTTTERPASSDVPTSRPLARPQGRLATRLRLLALTLFVFGLAAAPRIIGLADFFTIDEGYHWIVRVGAFSKAVADQDWDETNITGHPGVTTMWLGSLGRALALSQGLDDRGLAGAGAEYLALLRLPLAFVNSLAVALGFVLLQRLLGVSLALLAAVLWALDPFLIAHSRLLHLDGLLTSLVTLSLLLLLVACQPPAQSSHLLRRFSLIGSGLLAGLALVTKAPSLLWLPLAGVLMVVLAAAPGLRPRIVWALRRYALWLLAALVAALAAWPALWVTPVAALNRVLREIVNNGGQPHHSGNYFLGTPIADPGPLFYPLAAAFRLTPLALLGLLLLPLWYWWTNRTDRAAYARGSKIRDVLLALVAFAAWFMFALTLQPKKFDRYLLPIFPALDILAAVGLVAGVGWLVAVVRSRFGLQSLTFKLDHLVIATSLIFSLGTLSWYHPYYLAYFNPLFGGAPVAQRVLLVGWGEGMEEAGAWLSARPDLAEGRVLSWTPPNLMPFLPQAIPVVDLRPELLAEGGNNYAVLYVRSVQRQESAPAEALVRQNPPLYSVRRNGIVYATIHQLPRPFTTHRSASFNDELQLNGFSQRQTGATLVVTPSWSVTSDGAGGRFLFLHLLDARGRRVAQLDAPIDQGLFQFWQAGQQFGTPLPLALPAGLSPGSYRLVLGVYDPASGERLPLSGAEALPESVDGPHALLLEVVDVE